jgi:hypothetical protein
MTMVTGLEAAYNLTAIGPPSGEGATDKDATWAVLVKCKSTPITVQTFDDVAGKLQLNHIFTVLRAEEAGGIKA